MTPKTFSSLASIPFLLVIVSAFIPIGPVESEVEYPEGYRNWAHVKTAIVGAKNPVFEHFGGFHHIYANEAAMVGYRTGNFPEGSVLVFDVLEAVEKNTDISEGKRRIVDVMAKDSKRFASTGGWGFEEFDADTRNRNVKAEASVKCYSCHLHKKENDFVFSKWRE